MTSERDPASEQALRALAIELREAQKADDTARTKALLTEAAALDPDCNSVALSLARGEVLMSDGALLEAGLVFKTAIGTHPDEYRFCQRQADLARRSGEETVEAQWLEQALSLGPAERTLGMRGLLVRLLIKFKRYADAETHLKTILEHAPDDGGSWRRLAHVQSRSGDHSSAVDAQVRAIEAGEDSPSDRRALAGFKISAGDTKGGLELLETALADTPDDRDLLRTLTVLYRKVGQADKEEQCMRRLLEVDPLHPSTLRHVFRKYANSAPADVEEALLAPIQALLGDDLLHDLRIALDAGQHNHGRLLKALRQKPTRARTDDDVDQIASAAIGLFKPALGARYLRMCMRFHPSSERLFNRYVDVALKLGLYDELEREMLRQSAVFSDQALLLKRFELAGHMGQFEAARSHYQQLKQAGQVWLSHQYRMVKLAFCKIDLSEETDLFDDIGRPVAGRAAPHLRGTLLGQWLTELELEKRFGGPAALWADPGAWMRSNPGSTLAAARVIDAYCAAHPLGEPGGDGVIPRRIVQYWDKQALPEPIERMVQMWSDMPGFDHELYSRATATAFLKEHFGPDWLRAFRLAHHSAQEADFFRLCALVITGGIYADTDDVPLVAPDEVLRLARGRGLVVYRSPFGGSLGNNVIAARPNHPALRMAAEEVRDALIGRSRESLWSSSGPGLLNRAVARYLNGLPENEVADLAIVPWAEIAPRVGMHNPVAYKSSPQYWNNPNPNQINPWATLRDRLDERQRQAS